MENLMPKLRFVFDRRKEADHYKSKDASRTADVLLEVYYRQKRKWFKTGVKVFAGQWDAVKWVVNRPDTTQLNSRLSVIISKANAATTKAIDKKCFSISVIESIFKADDGDGLWETECLRYVEMLKKRGVSDGQAKSYLSVLSKMKAFGKVKWVEDATPETLAEFRQYMAAQGLMESTIYHYMSCINAICHSLVRDGKMESNPTGLLELRKPHDNTIRYLTEDEVDKIERSEFEKEAENYVRDLFIFQANTGMAYADAIKVNVTDVENDNGKWVYRQKRKKTGVGFAIIILPKAMEILLKYGQLNKYSLSYINITLNYVGRLVLGKRLTTHMARHSFAVKALRHGIPIEYVSKILGHTNIGTTQRYAKVLAEDVLKQFDKLM